MRLCFVGALFIQLAGLFIGNILQAIVFSPVIMWWSSAKAVLSFQWLIILHIIHQIEITHFIFVCSSEMEKKKKRKLKINQTEEQLKINLNIPDECNSFSIAKHCATRRQCVTNNNWFGVIQRVEHLWLHRIAFAE